MKHQNIATPMLIALATIGFAAAAIAADRGAKNSRGSDLCSEARQRFRSLDANGDNKIDEIEFMLRKVVTLSLIDDNRDGVITIEETLLSPSKFTEFDRDGDGKITAIEFIDQRTFDSIDGNHDKVITLEEYMELQRDE